MPEKQAAVDRLTNDDASSPDATGAPAAPSEPVFGVFARMHPIGVVAVAFALGAVLASIVGTDFLIGNLAIWHWVVIAVVIAISTQPSALNGVRVFIEGIGEVSRRIVTLLAWVVFGLQFFNVITRYTNNWFERDILFGQTTSAAWMSFGLLFILGVNYAMRDGVNPRIDFWWAEFSKTRKAWIDFVFHVLLLGPFVIMALRLVIPFGATSLGRKRDGTWPSGWRVWETWEQSSDASQLPVGPIQAALVLAFVLWGLQTVAEIIKTGFVLAGRDDLGEVSETDAPLRVE